MTPKISWLLRLAASFLVPVLTLVILLCQPVPVPWVVEEPPATPLTLITVQEVHDYYDSIGYTLDKLHEGALPVPRIYLESIIHTWAKNETISDKKSLFYRTMLPLVLRVNEVITAERNHIITLARRFNYGKRPDDRDQNWLTRMALRYKIVKKNDAVKLSTEFFNQLLKRVDAIPVSMALGQMAYESAYATSRFAGEGNALFGQWSWGKGMTPQKQRGGKGDYRIAQFQSPIESMQAYAMNMNTHRAYKNFRTQRAKQRQEGRKNLAGYSLAATMDRYSEKGEEYVATLQGIIKINKLSQLDGAQLSIAPPITLIQRLEES